MDLQNEFIEYVKAECKANGIRFILRDVKYLQPTRKIKCSGYFDEESKSLVVATKSSQWFEILVHEFAHLTQWKDQCTVWKEGGLGLAKMNNWLEGKQVRGIKQALAKVRDLELDNEKRSVRIIKKWNLPVDLKLYIQKANAYILFYNWMYYTRRWCSPKNSPIKNPAVYSKMPTTFRIDYTKLSNKHYKVFEAAGV